MTVANLNELLESFQNGRLSQDELVTKLNSLSVADLGFARVDIDRAKRRGMPEVVFGEGKRPEHIADIMATLAEAGQRSLATRITSEVAETVQRSRPELAFVYDPEARCLYLGEPEEIDGVGKILVICAGTSDLPVAAEAALTARLAGNDVELLTDVGVAGLHRLLAHLELIRSANVLIVCAGMEGALPSVIAGLVSRPIIAVPTSVGYGASFDGLAALLSMMNSCSAGVTVVNIDNGFGAGYAAATINRKNPT